MKNLDAFDAQASGATGCVGRCFRLFSFGMSIFFLLFGDAAGRNIRIPASKNAILWF